MDIDNFDRRWTDRVESVWTTIKLAAVVVGWAMGLVVIGGLVWHLAEIVLKPLFCFGYNVLPMAGEFCKSCVNGACEVIMR